MRGLTTPTAHLSSERRENVLPSFQHKLGFDIFKPDVYARPELPLPLLFPRRLWGCGYRVAAGAGKLAFTSPSIGREGRDVFCSSLLQR